MVSNSKILGIYFTTCNIYTKNPQKAQVKKHTQKSFYLSHLTNVLIFVYVLVTFIGNPVFYT